MLGVFGRGRAEIYLLLHRRHKELIVGILIDDANLFEPSTAAARLLCAVGEPYQYEETALVLECGGASFSAKGRRVTAAPFSIPAGGENRVFPFLFPGK